MPSPFPGMDPYLEGPDWLPFHGQFIAELANQLSPKLLPKYAALMGQREVLSISGPDDEETEAILYADVAVARTHGGARIEELSGQGTATLSVPLTVRSAVGTPGPQRFLEIRDTRDRRLVTLIEVLSPTNKRADGYLSYVQKRNEVFQTDVHLLEIDLHHAGRRVPTIDPLPAAPYFVFLSRGENRPMTDVWPIRLDEPLPTVPVPLHAPDADVMLDLQDAMTKVYDRIGYRYLLDYAAPPRADLGKEAAAWVEKRLQAAGVLPGQ